MREENMREENMREEVHCVQYDGVRLLMRFEGKRLYTSTVKIQLLGICGKIVHEGIAVPVKSLFDISELIDMSLKHRVAMIDKELDRMKKEKRKTNGKKN